MRRVGVTGGMGFIGRYVVEELLRRGYQPVIFDRQRRLPASYPSDVEVFLGDVNSAEDMTEFAAHVDGVIHLAAVLGTQETVFNPRPAAQSNLMGGLNFLEAVAQYNLPGAYIAVGNWWFDNPYSITKNMIERFVHLFNHDRAGRVNIVRAVNAYGPRQIAAAPFGPSKVRKIAPAFICRALCGMDIEVYGTGRQVSDMVYVGDVARALVMALESAADGFVLATAVEIGSPTHTTVLSTAKLVAQIVSEEYGKPPVPMVHLPMRPGEKAGERVTADNSTLNMIGLDSHTLTPLDEGMRGTVRWFAENREVEWFAP